MSGDERTSARRRSDASGPSARAAKLRWTGAETQTLVDGCNKHGVGAWSLMLADPAIGYRLLIRTPGDLKDRFRTYFPDSYHELYPNAKTHWGNQTRGKAPNGRSIFERGKARERRPFTAEEDSVVLEGYMRLGAQWALIARDPVFQGQRRSTDVRDHFRNAYPDHYRRAGYKPRMRPSHPKNVSPDPALSLRAESREARRPPLRQSLTEPQLAQSGLVASPSTLSAPRATSAGPGAAYAQSETILRPNMLSAVYGHDVPVPPFFPHTDHTEVVGPPSTLATALSPPMDPCRMGSSLDAQGVSSTLSMGYLRQQPHVRHFAPICMTAAAPGAVGVGSMSNMMGHPNPADFASPFLLAGPPKC
ncbi:hypothetical protein MSPP1_000586 [Malassezia sp. CBS 17886]|nr:hypothetical protein MSPP1_000586 [Malassezia sp. CBS 17886]